MSLTNSNPKTNKKFMVDTVPQSGPNLKVKIHNPNTLTQV